MYLGGLGGLEMSKADADALKFMPVTYRAKVITGGVDDITAPRTYVEPSGPWLTGIGFTGSNPTQRIPLPVKMVQEGYGEQAQMRPAPPDDPRALYLLTDAVNEGYGWFTTPVIQYEKAKGLTQQVAYRGGMRYYRYVDLNGKQVGPLVEFPPGGDAVVGKIVKVVAIAMIAAGAAQAVQAAAQAVTAPAGATPTGAASSASQVASAAKTIAPVASAAPAVTPVAAAVAPAAAAVAPTVAAGGGVLSTIAAALPSVGTAAKVATAVIPIVKAQQDMKAKEELAKASAQQQMPIAPPASLVQTLGPGQQPQFNVPLSSGTPPWMIPALIGGAGLLLVLLMQRRQQ